MIKIGLQGGHLYRTSGATGAPGEQELTDRIRRRLTELLVEREFQVFLFNADPPYENINQDFDLFLALHGDANLYGTGGGFADYPEPSTDGATAESQRICKVINDNYFNETGITYVNRSNKNTRYYYMWKSISAKTPCVIIELGVVQDAHDKVLLGNTELIANALARAICKAFGVSYEATTPELPQEVSCETKLEAALEEIKRLNIALSDTETAKISELALMQTTCSNYRAADKVKIKQDIIKLVEGY